MEDSCTRDEHEVMESFLPCNELFIASRLMGSFAWELALRERSLRLMLFESPSLFDFSNLPEGKRFCSRMP